KLSGGSFCSGVADLTGQWELETFVPHCANVSYVKSWKNTEKFDVFPASECKCWKRLRLMEFAQ
ncbi:hypothetical protein ACTXJU_08270, partial [Glutamicibacter ardleyensis]|uniref:hypothetical protein n=1 Tax=Glutamicibacter ardleyensis TaxID=225894 RepID=UPI003FD312B3